MTKGEDSAAWMKDIGCHWFLSIEPLLGPVDLTAGSGPMPERVIIGAETGNRKEKVRPECLGRVFGLHGAIMSWAMPVGLVFSSLFADAVGAAPWFAGAGAIMMALAAVTWLIPSIRGIERER